MIILKKYYLVFIIFSCLFVIGCGKKVMNLQYEPSQEHDIFPNKQTFLFTGESEHAYFTTGKAYYGKDELGLLITNFHIKDNIKEGALFTGVNVYFNNLMFAGDVTEDAIATLNDLSGISVGVFGGYPEYDEDGEIIGESDSFIETSKEEFKDALKITIKYCYKKRCQLEQFDITYHL